MTRYPFAESNYRRDTTPAAKLRRDAFPTGVFRCDRCDRVLPDSLAVEQDGYTFCRPLCADATSVTEITTQLAEQQAVTDGYAPNEDPPGSPFDGIITITSKPTFPIRLTFLVPVELVFEGVGFTADTTVEFSSGVISTVSAPTITDTSMTFEIVSSGVSGGTVYSDITIGNNVYSRVLIHSRLGA